MAPSPELPDLDSDVQSGAESGGEQPDDTVNEDSQVGAESTVVYGFSHPPDEVDDEDQSHDDHPSEGHDENLSEGHDENHDDGSNEESDPDDESDASVGVDVLDCSFEELYQKYRRLKENYEEQKGRFRRRADDYRAQIAEKNRLIAQLKHQLAQLKRQSRARRMGRHIELPTPWAATLERYRMRLEQWIEVYKASCRQGNMSLQPGVHHPDIIFTPTRRRLETEDGNGEVMDGPSEDSLIQRMPGVSRPEPQPFDFESLPIKIQSRIFRLWLVKGNPIHALSRLQRRGVLRVQDRVGQSGFPNRFWWKRSPCCVYTAEDPNDILRVLLVCKRWLYVGAGAFYGLNTFAFSSLGEMGRFFKGIGRARCERVTSIELFWQGSLMPTHETLVNQRTMPLLYLTRLKNLQTLLVFIAENPEWRMRRKYEMQEKDHYSEDYTERNIWTLDPFQSMVKQTATHPIFRKNRSMRTTHGMDYVYQLRGMTWVRFREVSSNRVAIRDWSFATDIATQVTMPKSQDAKREAEMENLADLCNEWDPSDLTLELVKSFYQPSDLDFVVGGSDTSESDEGSISLGSSSDSSSERSPSPDPSDDSGSDSGNSGGGNPYAVFPDEIDNDSGVEDVDMDVPIFKEEEDPDGYNSLVMFPDELDDVQIYRDVFPDEVDETQSSSRGISPANEFPDEMDYDSGIEDVDMDAPVFKKVEDSDEDISESSQRDSDGFDADDQPYQTQNDTTQSTSGELIEDDGHSVGHSTSLFVRSNRDDGTNDGRSVAQSRQSRRSSSRSSRDRMPPPRIVIDLTQNDDHDSTDHGEWDAESLFVHSKSGGSSDESASQKVIDLTDDGGSDGSGDSDENKVKIEPDGSSGSSSGGSEHPKRQRASDTASEPLPKRARHGTTFTSNTV